MNKKYNIGLIIGRFQPFHLGHQYLIDKALKMCNKIIIGIGSSNIMDENNPYSIEDRLEFLRKVVNEEEITDRIIKIVSLPDVPDDEEWFKLVGQTTGPVDVVIGDNEWVNGIYESHGIKVKRIGYHQREVLEGKKIRSQIRDKKPWKERVPTYIATHIGKKNE